MTIQGRLVVPQPDPPSPDTALASPHPEGVTAYDEITAMSPMVDYTQSSQDIDIWGLLSPNSKTVICIQCGNILYEMKGFRRHFDDFHTDPKECPDCGRWIIGQRKLRSHLNRDHKVEGSS
ncbi:hypothetical protein BGW80DRAFT_1351672 [Lactifluus volemus]|nr:hypothetical protein BGW80DRAFT_1351672 [Lactifluus volemus]